MTSIEKLEPWHIEVLYADGEISPAVYHKDYAEKLCQGKGYSLFHNGRIILAAGVVPCWTGVGEAWSIMTERCREKPVLLVKAFKEKFDECCSDYNRVQVTVEEGFEQGVSFVKYLGFTFEGRMPYYSPDQKTHLRFARVKWLQP